VTAGVLLGDIGDTFAVKCFVEALGYYPGSNQRRRVDPQCGAGWILGRVITSSMDGCAECIRVIRASILPSRQRVDCRVRI